MGKMENISCKEARDHMAKVINQVAFGRKKFKLTRHGAGVAVLMSLEEWETIQKMIEEKEDKEDIRDADLALKRHNETKKKEK
ncbi:MAG TPA: type II toxin-antitoxin system Phd/YefM family antitoxin [Rhabdochlamydiaceae bacterium]|nr:type II toxin-antitoxin system Phd/YefM family antitoxin [Rhabdochlamydiaceae bacterium]